MSDFKLKATKVLPLERKSFRELIADLQEKGPASHGIIALRLQPDGHAHFSISGFESQGFGDLFLICGLLDWLKQDLLTDLTGGK
jgi:hypothetical protein